MAESATSRPETASRLFEAKAIERFANHLRGTCLRPGDDGYDENTHHLECNDQQTPCVDCALCRCRRRH